MGFEKKDVAAIGDQIFTDIMGANLAGIRSCFVFPIEPETSLPFSIKRTLEKPLLTKQKTDHKGGVNMPARFGPAGNSESFGQKL